MTRPDRRPFVPLAPDIDDTRLEQLARDKGVGILERPIAAGPAESSAAPDTGNVHTARPSADMSATPRGRMKCINLELPDYVWTELKIRAVRQQCSLRHIVMVALRADGVTITDADMIEDGRRLR